MSAAHATRFGVFLVGAACFLGALYAVKPTWLAIAASVAAFVASDRIGAFAFERLSTLDERKADLEDRVRNPPD